MSHAPILLWFRRDLRLGDHPMLAAAAETGRPLIPVFVHDESVDALGAAAKWRLGLAVGRFSEALVPLGSRLILRRGSALAVLQGLLAETGARDVWWTRTYDPEGIARDKAVKSALKATGVGATSFAGQLLFEPMEVMTGQGGPYRVYSPFWRAVKDRAVPVPARPPARLPAPGNWPASDRLADWRMGAAMQRGADVLLPHARVGEAAAHDRLDRFMARGIGRYAKLRDFPSEDATSGLSENLAWGEIGPRTIWYAGQAALAAGVAGTERFVMELVWREFAWHLLYHTPHIASRNWREDWDSFPWRPDNDDARRWKRGMTGEPFVDAGLREMYVTGRMHNRVRMVVASYLTKNLLTDWRVGQRWFADCLTDWDPASNAMGWQWVAGSGPDAAPYFRIFNPQSQADKFDPDGDYRARWIAEEQARPSATALSYFDAVPRRWDLRPDQPYPEPVLSLAEGRARALAAYGQRGGAQT